MRVVLVVRRFPKPSTTFIFRKVLGLVEDGIDAHVLCFELDTKAWSHYRAEDVAVVAPRTHLVPSPVRPAAAIPLTAALVRSPRALRLASDGFAGWIAALAPEVVHFEFGSLARGHLTNHRWADATVVSFRGHDLNCHGLDQPDYYADVWAEADAIHCLGEDLWRRAVRRGCPPDKRHTLISPAVNGAFFDRSLAPTHAPSPVGTLKILSVGRLHWKKGYPDGLRAVSRLVDEGVKVEYRIVGDGPDREEIVSTVARLGLDFVRFLGVVRPDEVRAQLAWSDVLLHASVSEGFGNAPLEAQAMAVPVVCTDADGLPENVADGTSGVVVPRRDVEGLAAAMSGLAKRPELRRSYGEAGRDRALRLFRPEDQVRAFRTLYESLG